ncbi:MAG TPA: DUF1294 domain-containing protein [Soehngenia sp.]|nr:DUF1294 domain-containing protein [Soehngenia sp.]HPP32013.1 DUF1294 domain-containing protein [Soehngenia sp.]
MSNSFYALLIYIAIINVYSFYLFGKDKKLSKDHKWRISENKLLFVCFIGGSIGGLLGMKNFSHKTKKRKFTILIPLFLILQLYLIYEFIL